MESGHKMEIINRQARFKYHLHDTYTAGMVLEGWEVKAIIAGRVQINESYVIIKNGEIFETGIMITPLPCVSTYSSPNMYRTRKLLLNKAEIKKLMGKVHEKGMTIVPTKMFFLNGKIKLEIALATGKNAADKRDAIKERDWKKEQNRLMKRAT